MSNIRDMLEIAGRGNTPGQDIRDQLTRDHDSALAQDPVLLGPATLGAGALIHHLHQGDRQVEEAIGEAEVVAVG